MTPSLDNSRPAGKAPDVTDQVYGGVPPVAARVPEYGMPALPIGRGDVVVMEGAAAYTVSAAANVKTRQFKPIANFFHMGTGI